MAKVFRVRGQGRPKIIGKIATRRAVLLELRTCDRFSRSQVSRDINALFSAKSLADSGGQSLGPGHSDGAERNFDGGERGEGARAFSDAIESSDGDITGDSQAFFFQSANEIVGLVVCRANPGRHSVAGLSCYGLDAMRDTGDVSRKHSDHVFGVNFEPQPCHFFDEGTIAPEGPTGFNGIVPSVETDPLVSCLRKMVNHGRNSIVVIHIDTIDGAAVLLFHE